MMERTEILSFLTRGEFPPQVFGAERAEFAHRLYAVVAGIQPTRADVLNAALGYSSGNLVRAYRTGRNALVEQYYGESYWTKLPIV